MNRFGIMKKFLPLVTAALMMVMLLPANAALAAVVGPIDPRSVAPGSTAALSGFPAWYQDDNGVRVELFPVNAADNLIGPPNPANPYEVKVGFNTAFYWNAFGDIVFPNGGTGRIVFGYEAIWGNLGDGVVGQEVVFSRIRFGLKPGIPGTYTIQHPWGQDTMDVTAVDVANNRNVQFSDDVGVVPRVFTAAITPPAARETTFLKSLAAPPGKLGDGVTPGPVTGGKLRNSVIVTGPAGTVTVTDFVIAGRLVTAVIPVASFTALPATGGAPLTVNFADTSTGPAATWDWNFGDGTAHATVGAPTHVFTTPGTFTVTLIVTNLAGTATTTRVVTVAPGVTAIPVASFLASATSGAAPLAVSFTDTTTGVPTTWSWNFGDATPASAVQNPVHTYTAAGTFTVTELVTNALGSAATTRIITVTPPVPAIPVASFTAAPAAVTPGGSIKFTDTTIGVPTSWSWNFGDGGTSTLQSPTHVFATAGVFAVTETATNALGTASISQVITVDTIPLAPTTLTANATSSTQVNLTWVDRALNETLYMIQRVPNAAGNFATGVVELHTLANATTFTDITATANTTFSYRIIAANLVGNSTPSNVVAVTTPAPGAPVPPPPPPPVVTPPAPVGGGGGAPPPAVGGGGGGGGGGAPPAPVFSPVSLTGLVTSTGLSSDPSGHIQLDSQVKTTNDEVILNMAAGTTMTDSNGAPVNALSAAVSTSPPAAPSGSKILKAFTMGPDGAQFSPGVGISMRFDPAALPSGVTANELSLAFHDGTNWVKVDSTVDAAANTISAQVTHFTQFAIISPAAAPTPAAPAPPPTPVTVPDQVIAPAVPKDLTATINSDGQVFLHWTHNPATNENGFMVERASSENFATEEVEFHTADATESFVDITAQPGKTYFYKVFAVTGVGHSDASNVAQITVPVPSTTPAPVTPASTTPTTPSTPTPATPTAPVQPAGSNMGMIIGIVVAVVVVIGLAIFLMRKKPAA